MMELKDKRKYVKECVRLGMSFERAAIVSLMTPDEIEEAEKDTAFQHELEVVVANAEKSLLENHLIAEREAINKGNAAPTQWKLERMFPERWSANNKESIKIKDNQRTPNVHFYLPDNGRLKSATN